MLSGCPTPVKAASASTMPDRFDPAPAISCPPETGMAAGFSLGWINSINEDVLTEPGRHALLQAGGASERRFGRPEGKQAQPHLRAAFVSGIQSRRTRSAMS